MQRHKENKSTHLIEILILAFIWLALFASPLVVWSGKDSLNWGVIFDAWLRLLPFLGLSLLNHFILVPFLFFRKMSRFFAVATVTLVLFSVSFVLMQNHKDNQRPGPDNRPMFRDVPPDEPGITDLEFGQQLPIRPERRIQPWHPAPGSLPPYLNTFIISLLIMGFDTGMRSIFRSTNTEREKEKLEKEKVKSELAFLRNQISPHFFMNTLNNIHSLIDFDGNAAKDAVIRLSKLMQHLLYDSDKDTIPLKDEIAFIQSYTELMKLRVNEKVNVSLNIQTEDPGVEIPPLLFTSLIENAFKYGVSYRGKSFINISLVTSNNQLTFAISNSMIPGKVHILESGNSGIGLDNTRKRLELLYSKRFQMVVTNAEGVFTVTLTLPL